MSDRRRSNRAKAYSYLRFSTPDQLKGDSFRRQTEAANRYAERNGLDIDTELTFRDLGVSAFRGKNAVEGALGAFIAAVDSGTVKPGSYLLIESLDRLSRDRIMPALNRFSDLLGKGINVVTLSDGQVYTADSLNNLTGLLVPLVTMARANEESEIKSKRLRAAWKNKKAEAASGHHVVTSKVPAWLRVTDKRFEIIPERATIVRRIFAMALRGYGKASIARSLNDDGVPTFGSSDGWHASYIQKILRNPAVIGTYQPMRNVYEDGKKQRVPDGEPIEGYFPAIVMESDFYRVKHSKPGPSGKGTAPPRNVLSGLAVCGKCGGAMHYVNKGQPPKGASYLACDNARRKKTCEAKSVRYDTVLTQVLDIIKNFRDIEPDASAVAERNIEIDALGGKIQEIENVIETAVDALLRVPSETLERRLNILESQLTELKAKRDELREKSIANEDHRPLDEQIYITFMDASPRLPDSSTAADDMFAHMAMELGRLVERIEVEKDEPVTVIPKM